MLRKRPIKKSLMLHCHSPVATHNAAAKAKEKRPHCCDTHETRSQTSLWILESLVVFHCDGGGGRKKPNDYEISYILFTKYWNAGIWCYVTCSRPTIFALAFIPHSKMLKSNRACVVSASWFVWSELFSYVVGPHRRARF